MCPSPAIPYLTPFNKRRSGHLEAHNKLAGDLHCWLTTASARRPEARMVNSFVCPWMCSNPWMISVFIKVAFNGLPLLLDMRARFVRYTCSATGSDRPSTALSTPVEDIQATAGTVRACFGERSPVQKKHWISKQQRIRGGYLDIPMLLCGVKA